jgi:hypothetical protein
MTFSGKSNNKTVGAQRAAPKTDHHQGRSTLCPYDLVFIRIHKLTCINLGLSKSESTEGIAPLPSMRQSALLLTSPAAQAAARGQTMLLTTARGLTSAESTMSPQSGL